MIYSAEYILQRSIKLSVNCYHLTKNFPKPELYRLANKIRLNAVSFTSNIAEGSGRKTKAEYIHFIHIALIYLRELHTQLLIAQQIELAPNELFDFILKEVDSLQNILVSTIQKLNS